MEEEKNVACCRLRARMHLCATSSRGVYNASAFRRGDVRRAIVAAAIHHDDFMRAGDGTYGSGDLISLIQRRDNDRDLHR